MAHVRGVAELLPAWLERGRGCFVVDRVLARAAHMRGTRHLLLVTSTPPSPYAECSPPPPRTAACGALHSRQWCATEHAGPVRRGRKVVLADAAIEPEQSPQALPRPGGGISHPAHPEVRGYYAAGQRPRQVRAG